MIGFNCIKLTNTTFYDEKLMRLLYKKNEAVLSAIFYFYSLELCDILIVGRFL